MKKTLFTFIFARGGSKGIKNKNIKILNGKPLLFYSINMAKKFCKNQNIFVSTDSNKIALIAKKYGANIIKRPKLLSEDKSSELLAWKHAINYLNKKNIYFDIFLTLPTTSPLRSKADIQKCLNMFNNKCDIVVTGTKSKRSPWYNILKVNKKTKYASVLVKSKKKILNRQSAPQTFDMTTVAYVTHPQYILKSKNLLDGRVRVCEIQQERAVDIDNYYDLRVTRLLIKNKKNEK